MKLTGVITEIKESQQVTDTFKKRNFVVEYAENPQYPEYINFELIQDKCDLLDGFQLGQEVEVNFNLKGRKWINPEGETRYFNSLQAWKIEGVSKTNMGNGSMGTPSQQAVENDNLSEDDLPF